MPHLQKLPEAHTDFIVSLQWDGSAWPLAVAAIVAVAAFVGRLLYRRRRRGPR